MYQSKYASLTTSSLSLKANGVAVGEFREWLATKRIENQYGQDGKWSYEVKK